MQNIEFILIPIGALLIVVSALLGRRHKPAPAAAPPPPELMRPDVTPESIVELQAYLIELLRDLHELSSDMTADLDDRLTELKDVLEEADNKLEGLSTARAGKERLLESGPEPEAATETSEPEATPPRPPEPPTPPEEPEPEERAESRTAGPPTGRYREIYQMDDQELPIDEIARRMKMGKGEIQLILSLREKN